MAADSWNALLRVNAVSPEALYDRRVSIAVLDVDERGPAFGKQALSVLCSPGSPLERLRSEFRYFPYDWSHAEGLSEILSHVGAGRAACMVSSEGALFEYGSDVEIVANLSVIHAATAPDSIISGSVTRPHAQHPGSVMALRPRSIETFTQLAQQAHWKVSHVITRPFSYNVALTKLP